MILIILGVVLAALSIFVMVCPQKATKKKNREDENAVKKAKKMGIVYFVLAIVLIAGGCITGLKKEVPCTACGKATKCSITSDSAMCDECFERLDKMFGN